MTDDTPELARISAIEAQMHSLRLELDRRFANQDHLTELSIAAISKTIVVAQDTANRAVMKAEAAAERAYLETNIESLRNTFDAQIKAQKEALDAALTASRDALMAALNSSEKAIQKAEEATEKRFMAVNEFRGQLNDQAKLFITKTEVDYRFGTLEKLLENIRLWQHATDLKFSDYVTTVQANRLDEEIATWRRSVDAKLTAAESKSGLIYSIIAIAISAGVLLVAIYNLFSKVPIDHIHLG